MNKPLNEYFFKEDLRLRSIGESDIDLLVPIINDAYSYQNSAKGEPRTNPEHLRKRVTETNFYVLENDQELMGCVYLEPKGKALHFGLLTLIPEYRKKGIATEILNAIDQYAKDNGFNSIDLDYMSLAPWLKSYYQRYGFAETGKVINWGAIDLIRMTKKL